MRKFFLRVSERVQGLEKAICGLRMNYNRNDVLEEAIRALEQDSTDDSVGYGGFPNLLGVMELDAAFMDGNSRNCGAVAGVTNFLPVSIAKRLMQEGLHTFLFGEGAELFARECGLKAEPTLSDVQRERWAREIRPLLNKRGKKALIDVVRQITLAKNRNSDTTVMIVSD